MRIFPLLLTCLTTVQAVRGDGAAEPRFCLAGRPQKRNIHVSSGVISGMSDPAVDSPDPDAALPAIVVSKTGDREAHMRDQHFGRRDFLKGAVAGSVAAANLPQSAQAQQPPAAPATPGH